MKTHAAYSSLFDEILLNGKILDSATPPGVLTNFTNIFAGLTGLHNSVTSLQQQIDADTTDNTALHTAVTSLQQQIDADTTDNTALHTAVTNLQTADGVINASIAGLTTDVNNLQAADGVINASIDGLTTAVNNLQTADSDIIVSITNLTNSVATDVTNLQAADININSAITNAQSSIQTLTTALNDVSSNLTSIISTTNNNFLDLSSTVSGISSTVTNLTTFTDTLIDTNTNITDLQTNITDLQGTTSQNSAAITILEAYDWSSHNATQNISLNGHDITNVNNITCSKLNYTTLNPAPVVFANTYYVDKAGSDTNSGSALFPFLTIQKAIDVCESTYNGTAREIRVSFGTYDQQLTFKKARVQLTAVGSRYTNTACSITKDILVQVSGSADLFNSQIAINGFQIVGKVLDTSTSVHTLVLLNCYIYVNEYAVSQTCSVDNRTYMENCTVQAGNASGTHPLLNFASGGVSLISVSVTQKSTQSGVILSGTAYFMNCVLSTFTNDNTSSILLPLMQLTTSSVISQVVANCGFIFTSTTAKVHTATECNNVGIFINWAAGSTAGGLIPLTLLSNTFLLMGTVDGNLIVDSPASYYYLFHANCYTGHNNLSGQAHTMCGTVNVNKFHLCPAS